jgi:hypothetical protein
LNEKKIPYTERPLFTEYGGFGSSIHVVIPASAGSLAESSSGEAPRGEKRADAFVLALPLSPRNPAGNADDFPYSFEVALFFIEKILERGTEKDILVAFLGDEWSALPPPRRNPHLGMEDLIANSGINERTGLIYLEMEKESPGLVIHHGTRKTLAPLNLLGPLIQSCDSRNIPYTMAIGFNELYKLALAEGPSALGTAHGREIPAVALSGADPALGNFTGKALDAAALGNMLADYAASLDLNRENYDYHYLIFQLFHRTFFVSEYVTVILFLAVSALFIFGILIYSVVFRFRMVMQWKVFLKRSWVLILFYLLLVLSFEGAALTVRILTGGRIFLGNGGLTGGSPGGIFSSLVYGAAGIQLLLGTAFFYLISPALELIHVPRREEFYGNASVILGALAMFLAALLDITFMPLFMWAFIFIFLAACVRRPLVVLICGLLTLQQAAAALWTLSRTGNTRLGVLILSGNTQVILYTALISLPFFIILKRSVIITRRRKTPRTWFQRMFPRFIFLGAAGAALGVALFLLIPTPGPVPVRKTITDIPQGSAMEIPGNGEYLRMEVQDRVLLERRSLGITLEAPGTPLRFDLYLDNAPLLRAEAQEIPVIYAAPMPFRSIEDANSPNRNSIEFILGEGPPNPFTTEIVLPLDFSGFLRAEAVYATWDEKTPPQTALEPGENGLLRIIHRVPVGSP